MKTSRMKSGASILLSCVLCLVLSPIRAFGWHDETHLAVAKAAGYYKWYNTAGPDIAKLKAGSIEAYNHFFDNPKGLKVTPRLVLDQAEFYNDPRDRAGHLYGAIMGAIRKYETARDKKKYGEYHLAYAAHYITDLSQPLHNLPYDEYNKAHHTEFDATVNDEVLENISRIKRHMYEIRLRPDRFEEDLAREIARIAVLSRKLGKKIISEGRVMTRDEAYVQLGHSASLLRAVVEHFRASGRHRDF